MNFKFMKVNILSFFLTFIFITLFLYLISYKVLIKDFLTIEEQQNNKDLMTIFKEIDIKIKNMSSTVIDYSKWDDTYLFVQDGNKAYINENFREGSNTLESLGINFFIFENDKNEVVFSKYTDKQKEGLKSFENKILKNLKDRKKVSAIFNHKDNFVYIIKEPVLRSDYTGDKKGFLLAGKYISHKDFVDLSNVFNHLKFSNKVFSKEDLIIKMANKHFVKVKTIKDGDLIKNYIQFTGLDDKNIFTLVATNPRTVLHKGQKTIFILNLIISSFLLIILALLFKNQKMIEKYNLKLESEINIRTKELIETLNIIKSKNKVLDKLSKEDSLTKIKNRRSFFHEGQEILNKSIKENSIFSLLLIDIDYFKNINDSYGHTAGDVVLKKFCALVDEIISHKDTIFGRLGGEEFSIIFKDTDITETEIIAETIRKEIENALISVDEDKINFTISIGVVQRKDEKYLDELLALADNLLYKAKKTGRNRIVRESVR